MKQLDMKTIGACALLTICASAAQAGGPGGSYIQGSYANWDGFDDGYNIAASFLATPQARIFGEWTDTDLQHLRVGAGWVFPLAPATPRTAADPQNEFELGATYQRFDVGPVDDDGFGIHGVVRFSLAPEFRLAGRAEYVFMNDFDDEIIVGADVEFRFAPNFAAFASFDYFREADNLFKLRVRAHF
jgi:hypothetical protein